MQNEGQANKKHILSAETFFTSQFYDFNNESSQMEGFDISKEYLNSELSDKSMILRQFSDESFMKALQVYYKLEFTNSFKFWRKLNDKYKRKQSRNPKNQTKVFIKLFYLINKKCRSKIQASFVKIVKFTKNHQMKYYQTQGMKGLNKLSSTIFALNSKYYLSHPIVCEQVIRQKFREIKLFSMVMKNKIKLQRFFNLFEKFNRHLTIKCLEQKNKEFIKVQDKLQILIGTLSLLVNPIFRQIFYQLKSKACEIQHSGVELFHQNIVSIDSNSLQILPSNFKKHQNQFAFIDCGHGKKLSLFQDNKLTSQVSVISSQISQQYSSGRQNGKKINNQSSDYHLNQQLSFSKDLRKKSPSLHQKKNQLKFKNVPSSVKSRQSSQQKNNYQKFRNEIPNVNLIDIIIKEKALSLQPKIHITPINFKQMTLKLKGLKSKIKFQTSLNFQEKVNRRISINQKIIPVYPRKVDQLIYSIADLSNLDFMPCTPNQIIKAQTKDLKFKAENGSQKKYKIFKSTKSGKSLSNSDESQNYTKFSQTDKKSQKQSIKLSCFENMANNIQQRIEKFNSKNKLKNLILNQIQDYPSINRLQNSKSDKIIYIGNTDKSLSKLDSYLHLIHDYKDDYKLQNFNTTNFKKSVTTKQIGLKTPSNYLRENGNSIGIQKMLIEVNRQRSETKSTSLAFKTKRPMRSVKSGKKQIPQQTGIKTALQIKKQKQMKIFQKDKPLQSKKHRQTKLDERKQRVENQYYTSQSQTLISIKSAKSHNKNAAIPKSPSKSQGIKIVNKK